MTDLLEHPATVHHDDAVGAGLVLCGAQPKALQRMERFVLGGLIGPENVLAAMPRLGANIESGAERGRISKHR